MNNTTFIDSEGHLIKTSSTIDEHQIIKIFLDFLPIKCED